MKKLIFYALLFIPILIVAQPNARKYDAFYISATLDPNQLFNFVDNPRMSNDVTGLNYRLEAGAMDKNIEAFFFYEDFPAQQYQTFGAGAGVILTPSDKLFLVGGLNYGFTIRDYWKHNGAAIGGGIHGKIGYHLNKKFVLIAEGEAKQRPDLEGVAGVLQGKIGIRYLFNQKGARDGWRFR